MTTDGPADDRTGDHATYTLHRFPEQLAVVRLAPGAELPGWAESSSLLSVTATATETSLVCAARSVPTKARSHKPYTGFAVAGPLDPALTGVLHALLGPLREAAVPVFTISTYDTDWLLVPRAQEDEAADAWRRHGHTVEEAVPVTPTRKGTR